LNLVVRRHFIAAHDFVQYNPQLHTVEQVMSHPFHRALTTAFASILFSAVTPHCSAGDSAQVAAQRLTAPTASSKVGAVLWTRRADRYTLQVVFPRESRELILVDGRRPKLDAENPAAQIPGAQ